MFFMEFHLSYSIFMDCANIHQGGAKKNANLTLKVFGHLAVLPEDVSAPMDVFSALSPILIGEPPSDKTTFTLMRCLTTLCAYNLLKGSVESGVFLHGG